MNNKKLSNDDKMEKEVSFRDLKEGEVYYFTGVCNEKASNLIIAKTMYKVTYGLRQIFLIDYNGVVLATEEHDLYHSKQDLINHLKSKIDAIEQVSIKTTESFILLAQDKIKSLNESIKEDRERIKDHRKLIENLEASEYLHKDMSS